MEKSSFQPRGMRVFLIRADRYSEGELSGRVDHICLTGEKPFASTFQMLMQIQQLLDTGQCPCVKPVRTLSELYEDRKGIATFQLEVLFTQNHSWQGRLTWLEQKQEANFRSVLELMMILDDVLADE